MPVWINSPLTGDSVPLSFTVNVGWQLSAFKANETIAVTVSGGGTVSPSAPVLVPGDSGDMNFTVTFAAATDNVTVTTTLTAGAASESDNEAVNVVAAPVVQIGAGPAPPGPNPVPLPAKGAGDRTNKQLIIAGRYGTAVTDIEVAFYAFAAGETRPGHTPSATVGPEFTLQAGKRNGLWAVALPPRFAAPHPQKKHHYQVRVTAKGGIAGGVVATACAAIPNVAIETDLPTGTV